MICPRDREAVHCGLDGYEHDGDPRACPDCLDECDPTGRPCP